MKKTLFVHIGTPKTGTSAIQNYCSINNARIQATGTIYPNLGFEFPGIGITRHAHFLVNTIKNAEGKRDKAAEAELVNDGLERLMAGFEEYDKVVISDENLWNSTNFNDKKVNLLKSVCDEHDVDLKFIVYLRRQDVLIQSYWAQQVKEKMPLTFTEYIESGKYKFFKLDYYERLEKISAICGKESLIVRTYEKSQYYKGSITADFLHLLGIETDPSFQEPDHVVNPSLSGPVLEVKRILNKMEDYSQKGSFIIPLMNAYQNDHNEKTNYSGAEYFTPDMHRDFMAQYEESNRKTAQEYLGREDGILFYEEIEVPAIEDSPLSRYDMETMILVCGELLARQHDIVEGYKEKLKEKNDEIYHIKQDLQSAERNLHTTETKLNSMVAYYNQSFLKRGSLKVKKILSRK